MNNTLHIKNIVVFSLHYPPFIGGAEIAVKEIASRLPQYHFHVITLRRNRNLPKEQTQGNISVYRICLAGNKKELGGLSFPGSLLKYTYIFGACRKARALHKVYHFDAMWSVMAAYASFAGLLFKRKTDIPWVVTLQEGIPKESIYKQAFIVWPFFKKIFRRATIVQAISTYLSGLAEEMEAKHIVVVPNGVLIKEFSEPNIETVSKYKKIFAEHFGEEKTILVTASRLDEKNGVKFVVEALPKLPESVVFAIAGDGPLKEMLRAEVKKLGLEKRVLFLGHVAPLDVPAVFAVSDIFIRASLSEGLGNAFLEAMASNLPVIGTNVGGIPDIITDPSTSKENANGLLVRPANTHDIVSAVTRLLDNPVEKDRLKEAGRLFVERGFDWSEITRKMDLHVFTALFH